MINSVITFLKSKSQKTPSNGTLLGKTSKEVFVMLVVIFGLYFIFVSSFCRCCCCYLSFFFISFPGYFTMSPALHPGFTGP